MSQKTLSKNNNNKHKFNLQLLPTILVLAFVPLIVLLGTYKTNLTDFAWFSEEVSKSDYFLYNKAILFILLSIIMCIYIIYKAISEKKNIRFTSLFIPLGIYGLFALLSSLFSKYSYFSFHGIYDHFESIFVILGYCMTAYYTYLCIKSEEDIKQVLRYWMIGLVILCLLGILQALSIDFFQSSFGRSLMNGFANVDISFNFEAGRVYMTFFNPNYVGTFVVLVMPILLVLTFHSKKLSHTIFLLILCIGFIFCLLGSQSRSGIIAIAVSALFMIVLYRKELLRKWKITIPAIILFILAVFAFNILNNNVLFDRIATMFQNTYVQPNLTALETNDDNITMVYKGEALTLEFFTPTDTLLLKDSTGTIIDYTTDQSGTFLLNDDRFSGIQFKLKTTDGETINIMQAIIDGKEWNFTNMSGMDDTYYYYNNFGKYCKLEPQKKALPASLEPFASGRGYIWSRTIPLLKDTILLGTGADTFSIVYPQTDYLGKHNNGFQDAIVTKPHNMYLQIAVQTGVLSLIALIVFYLLYFFSSIRLYWKCDHTKFLNQIGIGILIGSFGYMIAGLTNDATITIAPVFYTLLGLGIATNHLVKKEQTR